MNAVRSLDAQGPVTIGAIASIGAFQRGVIADPRSVGSYTLRSMISWSRLQTDLATLTARCELVRHTEAEWVRRLGTFGALSQTPSRTTWAYMTPERVSEFSQTRAQQRTDAPVLSPSQLARYGLSALRSSPFVCLEDTCQMRARTPVIQDDLLEFPCGHAFAIPDELPRA
jgi:hypothetical protein